MIIQARRNQMNIGGGGGGGSDRSFKWICGRVPPENFQN